MTMFRMRNSSQLSTLNAAPVTYKIVLNKISLENYGLPPEALHRNEDEMLPDMNQIQQKLCLRFLGGV